MSDYEVLYSHIQDHEDSIRKLQHEKETTEFKCELLTNELAKSFPSTQFTVLLPAKTEQEKLIKRKKKLELLNLHANDTIKKRSTYQRKRSAIIFRNDA